MLRPKLEETVTKDFVTSSPTTGAVQDADLLPTCEVFEDTVDAAIITPIVTKRVGKTGNYRVSVACTAVNGFEAGKSYNVVASATVAGVSAKAVISTIQMRTQSIDDLLATSGYTAPANAAILAAVANDNTTVLAAVAAVNAKTVNLPSNPAATTDIPSVTQNADALLDRVDGVESNRTLRQALRIILASAAGRLAGAPGPVVVIRDTNNTKDRITATVDTDGNRLTVVYDLS